MVYRQNLPIHIKFQQQEIKKKFCTRMFRKMDRFAWISTLIDIENKPDKIQLMWSCDDVIYPQSRPLGSFNLDEW